ncbi:MAG: ThiF family adenylyltransferase [Phycisphaerae bacterium]
MGKHENRRCGADRTGPSRYSRQVLYEHLDEAAQAALLASRVTLIGCGALGTVIANTLVRAGVGFLRLVDRDTVEWNNLQRQVLFDEKDAAAGRPKAIAAAERLNAINSEVDIEPVVADAHSGNIETLVNQSQLILDGTDNFETRYLINDVAIKTGTPWIYGACVGASGMMMPVLPGRTPCLRCIWDTPPPPGISPTCDTAGVLGPIVQLVAATQAMEALKILAGRHDAVLRRLFQFDAWSGRYETFDMQRAYDEGDCLCCKRRTFEYLDGEQTSRAVSLCGREAVQVAAPQGTRLDLGALAARLALVAKSPPKSNRYLLRFGVEGCDFTVFPDGRAIIKGVTEPDAARTLYARYVGA